MTSSHFGLALPSILDTKPHFKAIGWGGGGLWECNIYIYINEKQIDNMNETRSHININV